MIIHLLLGSAAAASKPRLLSLSPLDLAIVVIYFLTGDRDRDLPEEVRPHRRGFFMAGRQMTAWVAGLSFISANLSSLETDGLVGGGMA